jgi:hypothetical protein
MAIAAGSHPEVETVDPTQRVDERRYAVMRPASV